MGLYNCDSVERAIWTDNALFGSAILATIYKVEVLLKSISQLLASLIGS